MVARWSTWLQPFVSRLCIGLENTIAMGMSYHALLYDHTRVIPAQSVAGTLLHQVTPEEDRVKMVTPSDPYLD